MYLQCGVLPLKETSDQTTVLLIVLNRYLEYMVLFCVCLSKSSSGLQGHIQEEG